MQMTNFIVRIIFPVCMASYIEKPGRTVIILVPLLLLSPIMTACCHPMQCKLTEQTFKLVMSIMKAADAEVCS